LNSDRFLSQLPQSFTERAENERGFATSTTSGKAIIALKAAGIQESDSKTITHAFSLTGSAQEIASRVLEFRAKAQQAQYQRSKVKSLQWAFFVLVLYLIGALLLFWYRYNCALEAVAKTLGSTASDPRFQSLLKLTGTDAQIQANLPTAIFQYCWPGLVLALVVGLIVRWITKPAS
jgi:hypothetical protein